MTVVRTSGKALENLLLIVEKKNTPPNRNHSINKRLRLYFLHLGDEGQFKTTQTSEDDTSGEYGEEEIAEDL